MEEMEGSEKQVKLIGYGTFLIRSANGENIFNVVDTGTIKNFIRIYHPKFEYLGVFYPFAVPTKNERTLKALVYEVSVDALRELDFYEGVPHLFERTSCEVVLSKGKKLTSQIYIPTGSTCRQLKDRLKDIINEEELREMWENDLWIKCLEEQYPLVKKVYPTLFE